MSKGSSTYLLRLPASLKAAVAEISKKNGTSMNQFVTTAVAERVSAMKTAEFFTTRAGRPTSRWHAGCCAATRGSHPHLTMP